jgi:hypothetical protein
MALKIYEDADPGAAFSDDDTFSNPIAHAFDGTTGGVVERRFYVRNDDIGKTYTGVTVQPIDGGDNLVDGSNGFSWKLAVGDTQPLEAQWDLVTAGDSISLSDITDTTTYVPFWVRIEVPQGAEIQSFQTVNLRTQATESI